MNFRVSIRAAAHAGLRRAWQWYERQRPGLGDEFFLSVADALTCLEESPKQYPVYYREFRRLMTERFPYKIFFRINDDAVIVFRVLHAARDHTRELD